jgi:hypothetical protein
VGKEWKMSEKGAGDERERRGERRERERREREREERRGGEEDEWERRGRGVGKERKKRSEGEYLVMSETSGKPLNSIILLCSPGMARHIEMKPPLSNLPSSLNNV